MVSCALRWLRHRLLRSRIAERRWRCRDLQDRIGREFGVSLHERTVGKLLSKLRFRRLSVRPQHPQSDPKAQALFRASSPVS